MNEGDTVIICHPWFDATIPGGETQQAKVTRITEKLIHVEGYGAFDRRTLRKDFNTKILEGVTYESKI